MRRLTLVFLLLLSLGSSPLFAQDLPRQLSEPDALGQQYPGLELNRLPGAMLVVALPEAVPQDPRIDPYYGIRLDRTLGVYSNRGALLLRVHYTSPDRELALRVGRLAARLARLHRERFGREPQFPNGEAIASIWLSPHPGVRQQAGGETRNHHIYLYQVHAERSAIEWARTVTHEWGHLTLPAARGYIEPEGDAAGYLGERLFLKWLQAEPTAELDDFCQHDGLTLYYQRQISPLEERYNASGPTDKRLTQRNTAAMDYYIGMALASDTALGSTVLGWALFHTASTEPRALVDAIRNSVFLRKSLTVQLPAWVPFAPDTYQVRGETGKVWIDVRPVEPRKPSAFRVQAPGFKRVRTATGAPAQVTIERGVTSP